MILSSDFLLEKLNPDNIHSELPQLISEPFKWLESNLDKRGALFDKDTNSSLYKLFE